MDSGRLAAVASLLPSPGNSEPPVQALGRSGGRDWARKEAGRDLEKPPRLHCSGRGRLEEPVPANHLPVGLSVRGSQVLSSAGPRRCRLAGTRNPVRGPRGADQIARGGPEARSQAGDCC